MCSIDEARVHVIFQNTRQSSESDNILRQACAARQPRSERASRRRPKRQEFELNSDREWSLETGGRRVRPPPSASKERARLAPTTLISIRCQIDETGMETREIILSSSVSSSQAKKNARVRYALLVSGYAGENRSVLSSDNTLQLVGAARSRRSQRTDTDLKTLFPLD